MNKLSLVIAIISLAAVFGLMMKVSDLEKKLRTEHTQSIPLASTEEEEEIEIAVYMGRIQRYANKLYAASTSGNGALVNFYIHEMEEVMETLIGADLDEDGFAMNESLEEYGIKALAKYKRDFRVNGKESAIERHSQLVLNCNSCHAASGHPFLKMEVPQELIIQGQTMAP